jgi:DNA mismatch repair protein MutS
MLTWLDFKYGHDIVLEFKKPLGAFVELSVPSDLLSATPKEWECSKLQHLQTLASSAKSPLANSSTPTTKLRKTQYRRIRFRHTDWTHLHASLATCHHESLQAEKKAFGALTSTLFQYYTHFVDISKRMTELDISCSLAQASLQRNTTIRPWIKPTVVDRSVLEISSGRHPVLESLLAERSRLAISNDCHLDISATACWLCTGPNMGGKSTFLRQNALLIIMAQIGSFVPCESATIGICDQIFSRVGSSDDLGSNQSSFMVEMNEASRILKNATERSFVIIDELGRGTGSRDGFSIAWAILRHFHLETRCRMLFATHFYDLVDKCSEDPAMQSILPVRTEVIVSDDDTEDGKSETSSADTENGVDWREDILFTHKVVPGTQRTSYAIHVAKLAGLPDSVLIEASKCLEAMKK